MRQSSGPKRHYLKWTQEDVTGLESFGGIKTLYTEIDDAGKVFREIGVNKEGKVVHKCPSAFHQYGQYGIFDNQRIKISNDKPSITKEEFEKLWG